MKPIVGAAALAAILGLAGPVTAQPEDPGHRLVQRSCAQCHAIDREGESRNRAAPPFRDLFMRYSQDTLDKALREGLLAQHPAMPQFRFAPAEVDQIIRYLKAIQSALET
jgi:cytochrome c